MHDVDQLSKIIKFAEKGSDISVDEKHNVSSV
jgi:hypothetical protein